MQQGKAAPKEKKPPKKGKKPRCIFCYNKDISWEIHPKWINFFCTNLALGEKHHYSVNTAPKHEMDK